MILDVRECFLISRLALFEHIFDTWMRWLLRQCGGQLVDGIRNAQDGVADDGFRSFRIGHHDQAVDGLEDVVALVRKPVAEPVFR